MRGRALAGAGLAGLAVSVLASPHRFVVSRRRLPLPGLERPVRVVQLSDLHLGPVFRAGSLAAWVRAAQAEAPDLIVITGDLVDDETPPPRLRTLLAGLEPLEAPLGVWAVFGNHDRKAYRGRRLAAYVRRLEAFGVWPLVNEGLSLRPDLHLGGVDDLWWGRPDVERAFHGAPSSGARLLLCHNPDLLPRVPPEVALTLSGHTHGGQIVLPGVGPLYTGSSYRARFASGLVQGPALGYVSRGLGTSGPPVRLGCPPELPVLDLVPVEG